MAIINGTDANDSLVAGGDNDWISAVIAADCVL
jgi:hypothetical protein